MGVKEIVEGVEMMEALERDLSNLPLDPQVPHANLVLASAQGEQSEPGKELSMDWSQWLCSPNSTFRPAGHTAPRLPSGLYSIGFDSVGIFFEARSLAADTLVDLPDLATGRVLASIQTFWASRQSYQDYGLLHKRGILLWGEPGGGKTATVTMVMQALVKLDGLALLCSYPRPTILGLQALRRIEPKRPLMVIYEDLDEIIATQGEHEVLALLDGEHQTDNVVNIATTNYPERLGARIVNRPCRFDERVYVGMPSPAARRRYLEIVLQNPRDPRIEQWVADTDRMSIAHLREMAAAVCCMGQSYEEVLGRLRSLCHKPRPVAEWKENGLGFSR